ncbi:hypothetical protein [Ollibium composti]|uniref:Uncharacterized protein n=1 Tax=Ollibium composti TaxID=2675109 RepID=A0ABY2QAK7_9HYPH|nr:hypothetical protein [Mesorhizobium composti]THF58713.1 hypothetical protein E6C48_03375 [Mesorhizobium composti]
MTTRTHRGANDDDNTEFDYEKDYDELEDAYAPVVGMAVELIEAGRMIEDRPEDRIALKLSRSGAASLTADEMDVVHERLNPLVELYWKKDRTAFEAEFSRRRVPGFYDESEASHLARERFRKENPPEVEFRSAAAPGLPFTAPQDGSWFVGKDRAGHFAHVRWRSAEELESGENPDWVRWDTDEHFDLIAWVPSCWTGDDMAEAYV